MMKLLLAVQVVGLFLLLLGKASAQADQSVRDKLASSIDEYGLTAADVASIATTNVGITSSGVEVVHLQQILRGIPVKNGRLLGTVGAETKIKKNTFQKNLNTCANARNPTLSAEEAVRRAGEVAGVASPEELQVLFKENGPEKTTTFQGSNALSIDETIPSHLTYYIADEDCDVRLSWQVLIHPNADEWLDMVIDAVSGESIFIDNWVSGASFLSAFEAPKEAPCKTCTEWGTPEFNPYNVDLMTLATVPDAWLDGTGITRGNNVYAVADIAANNVGVATTATSGTNIFDYRVDLSLSNPSQWKNAAVVNLFYWNNIIHDVLYEYGFDEVNGNFQEDNNGKGGASGDSVKAEAQDGSGTNNANMSTPPDGSNPRMQMFMWNGNLDSSFDSGVIAHEYCHGLSIRLTGGPSTSGCLYQEQAGEGWSDYCALFFTSKSTNERIRTIGSYVTGRANGIRRYPYSNDMLINPLTYNAVGTNALSVPHGIGSFFATVLWDITLGIMDYEKEQCRPDFNPNKKETTIGGNNIAFQLVVDGLKFQPCGPTFVDSRDAILTADESRGGEYHCLLWKAFARRGLGVNAVSPNNCAVGCNGFRVRQPVESFDVPANCVPDLPPGPCVVESPAISPRPTSSPSMQPPVSSCVGSRESCANAETCCPGLSCKRNGRWAGTCA